MTPGEDGWREDAVARVVGSCRDTSPVNAASREPPTDRLTQLPSAMRGGHRAADRSVFVHAMASISVDGDGDGMKSDGPTGTVGEAGLLRSDLSPSIPRTGDWRSSGAQMESRTSQIVFRAGVGTAAVAVLDWCAGPVVKRGEGCIGNSG